MNKLTLVTIFLYSNFCFARGNLWLQGRLFIANTNISPNVLNDTLKTENLNTVSKTFNYGVEITFPVSRFFEPGMRYTHRILSVDENPSSILTNYEFNMKQDSILLLARFPIIKSSFFRIDSFIGGGGSNTKMTLLSSSHDGTYSKEASSDWYASPYYSYGASFGVGLKSILIYGEAGYESNKVKNFKTAGSVNSNLSELNLKGNYFMIGLMFDGIEGSKK